MLLTRFLKIIRIPQQRTGTVPDSRRIEESPLITHGGIQVKKKHWIALSIGIVIVLGIYAMPGITQTQPAAQPAPTPYLVAVVDVAQLIKEHPAFKAKQAALKTDVEKAEAVFKTRQEAIADKQKRAQEQGIKPGDARWAQVSEEIAAEMAKFETDAKIQQQKFALANSRIMFDTYKDIKTTIGRFAEANNIAQVTDIREFDPNPEIPQTVAEDMDQRLVWYSPRLNMTQHIMNAIYAAHPGAGPVPTAVRAGGAAVANPTTPGAPARQ